MQITVQENVQEELQDLKEKLPKAGPAEPETSQLLRSLQPLRGAQPVVGRGHPPRGQYFYEKYDLFCVQAWGGTGAYGDLDSGACSRRALHPRLPASQLSCPLRERHSRASQCRCILWSLPLVTHFSQLIYLEHLPWSRCGSREQVKP